MSGSSWSASNGALSSHKVPHQRAGFAAQPRISLEQRTQSALPKTKPQLAPETIENYINGKADSRKQK